MAMPYNAQQNALFQPYQFGENGMQPVQNQSNFNKFLHGSQERFQRIPTQTPQNMSFLDSLVSGAQSGLQNPYAGFEPIRQDVTRQFNTETVPGIAERFTAGNAQRSSAFQGALGNASSSLASKLAAMQSQYGLENRRGLLEQGRLGLTPQFENIHRPETQGLLGNLMQNIGPLAGAGADIYKTYQGGKNVETLSKNFGQFGDKAAQDQQGQGGQGASGNQASFDWKAATNLAMKILPFLI